MDSDIVEMQRKLETLGESIDRREQELRRLGTFSDAQQGYFQSMRQAHAELAGRVMETPRLHWLGVKDELVRDYNALVDDLARLTESLDEGQMKSPRP